MKRISITVLALLSAVLAGAAVVGCTTPRKEARIEYPPRALTDVEQVHAAKSAPPIVALALGGGGLRGFAHVGVLRALEEAGISPQIVVGTSAGALIGAAYASGMTAAQVEAAAREVDVSSLVDWTFSASGLMHGDNIARWVETLTQGRQIESFPRRFGAVATALESGRAVLLDRGSAGRAVQASAAVPGVTVPVRYDGGHLVDGGITSLVPVRFARAMGADVVIAVDIYCQTSIEEAVGAGAVLRRIMHMQNCLVAAPELATADIVISPAMARPGISARDEHARTIEAGYKATKAALSADRWLSLMERR